MSEALNMVDDKKPSEPYCKPGRMAFGRKAVKLSKSQKGLLAEELPKVEIPLDLSSVDPGSFFDGDGPLHMEIGFGSGEYTAALAKAFPDYRIIGCEIFKNGIASLLKYILEEKIKNIRIVQGNALHALSEIFIKETFDCIHINYPDPWPKRRHHKRRIIQPESVDLFYDALKPHGEVWLSTDIENYHNWMVECFDGSAGFMRIPADGRYLDAHREEALVTRFEARGEMAGRGANYLCYRKVT